MSEVLAPLSLLLFVRGNAPGSRTAISLLRRICDSFRVPAALQVVDVFQQPELAKTHGVLATPTLLARVFGREKRIVGQLNEKRIRECLEFDAENGGAS